MLPTTFYLWFSFTLIQHDCKSIPYKGIFKYGMDTNSCDEKVLLNNFMRAYKCKDITVDSVFCGSGLSRNIKSVR